MLWLLNISMVLVMLSVISMLLLLLRISSGCWVICGRFSIFGSMVGLMIFSSWVVMVLIWKVFRVFREVFLVRV